MKILSSKNSKNKAIKWIIVYSISVILIYLYSISPLFSYSGLTTRINVFNLVVCGILFLTTVYNFPIDRERASSYLFYLIYLISYIPTLMYTWMNDMKVWYAICFTFCIVLVELFLSKKCVICFKLKVEYGSNLFLFLFFAYLILSICLIVLNKGIDPNALKLYSISANRSDVSGIWGYILNWCAKSFSPIFFAYFLYKKNIFFTIVVSLIQLLFYLSFGFKAFLFSIALLLLMAYVLNGGRDYFYFMPALFSIIIVVSFFLAHFNITSLFLFTFPYRTLFIPAQTQYQYYEFFTNHDFLYFSEGFIGSILNIEYRYSLPIGVIVNQYFYGPSYYSNGNTGIFSYGFADCGFLGMILASLILVLVFAILDGSTKDSPLFIVVSAMSYQMIILNDTNILISLNTGGIIWTICLLIICNSIFKNDLNGRCRNKMLKSLIS